MLARATAASPVDHASRVLGVDPGLAATGWAVLERGAAKPRLIASGTIRSRAGQDLGRRLEAVYRGLKEVIAAYVPAAAAVEQILVAKSSQSALALGQARGVALLAAAEAGLPVREYLPMHVKQVATGYGHAEKEQVERMIPHLVTGAAPPDSSHAADAVAIALCHLGHGGLPRAASRGRKSSRAAWTAFVARSGR